jgi:hypothetical protein
MPIVEILDTHTDGQLYCMAVASRIQAEGLRRRMDRDMAKQRRGMRSTREAPATTFEDQRVKPPKPLKLMTKQELDDYYMRSGAWG